MWRLFIVNGKCSRIARNKEVLGVHQIPSPMSKGIRGHSTVRIGNITNDDTNEEEDGEKKPQTIILDVDVLEQVLESLWKSSKIPQRICQNLMKLISSRKMGLEELLELPVTELRGLVDKANYLRLTDKTALYEAHLIHVLVHLKRLSASERTSYLEMCLQEVEQIKIKDTSEWRRYRWRPWSWLQRWSHKNGLPETDLELAILLQSMVDQGFITIGMKMGFEVYVGSTTLKDLAAFGPYLLDRILNSVFPTDSVPRTCIRKAILDPMWIIPAGLAFFFFSFRFMCIYECFFAHVCNWEFRMHHI
eukprot:TRINITY_DN1657_c0_g2_i10.p1 TRINITY_DN1657_c0_g2~~TRINITY_DN1657_c0_g2_i10.p1  ORF type:complete len:305 (+),score=56.37 TRINITY_DN1657_c0_g2_i10:71-985(+)